MGTARDLVSIIMPVFNVEAYLRECIESALNQTYRTVEVVLVDDGSPDDCPQICDEYATRDRRIKVIHQSNCGLSAARNAGLAVAGGEYVYFLDSDDYIAEHAIMELHGAARGNELDVVLFDGLVIDENGTLDEADDRYIRRGAYDSPCDGRTLFTEMVNNGDYRTPVPLLFIRKNCLTDYGLFFREGIVHEDELFTFLLLMQCKRAMHLRKPLYYRRMRNGSIMTVPVSEKNLVGCMCVLEEMVRYCAENEFDAHVARAVKKRIAAFFGTTYNRYKRLSKSQPGEHTLQKEYLFSLMKNVDYLNDWRNVMRCRYGPLYEVCRRVLSLRRSVLKQRQ